MKQTLALALCASVAFCVPAQAQNAQCQARERAVEVLAEQYG